MTSKEFFVTSVGSLIVFMAGCATPGAGYYGPSRAFGNNHLGYEEGQYDSQRNAFQLKFVATEIGAVLNGFMRRAREVCREKGFESYIEAQWQWEKGQGFMGYAPVVSEGNSAFSRSDRVQCAWSAEQARNKNPVPTTKPTIDSDPSGTIPAQRPPQAQSTAQRALAESFTVPGMQSRNECISISIIQGNGQPTFTYTTEYINPPGTRYAKRQLSKPATGYYNAPIPSNITFVAIKNNCDVPIAPLVFVCERTKMLPPNAPRLLSSALVVNMGANLTNTQGLRGTHYIAENGDIVQVVGDQHPTQLRPGESLLRTVLPARTDLTAIFYSGTEADAVFRIKAANYDKMLLNPRVSLFSKDDELLWGNQPLQDSSEVLSRCEKNVILQLAERAVNSAVRR